MKKLFFLGITFALAIILGFNAHAAGDAAKGKAAYAVCLACHGADGMGNKALNSPQILQSFLSIIIPPMPRSIFFTI